MSLLKRQCESDPGSISYLTEDGRRVVVTAMRVPGGFLVWGKDDTIVQVSSELEADRLACSFAFAAL